MSDFTRKSAIFHALRSIQSTTVRTALGRIAGRMAELLMNSAIAVGVMSSEQQIGLVTWSDQTTPGRSF